MRPARADRDAGSPRPAAAVPDHLTTCFALVTALGWFIVFVAGARGIIVAVALAGCGVVALGRGRREAATLAFTTAVAFTLVAVPLLTRLWPAPLFLALALALGVSRFRAPWLERGDCGGRVAGGIAIAVALSAGALVAWWALIRPGPRDLPTLPLALHPALLAAGAIAWAAVNAAAEELYFRGALQHVLVRALGRPGVAVQALAFGFMHYRGFPRGWSGVVLATVFGLMMGALRSRAGGLLAPWIAHLGADLTIALILWFAAVG